MKNQSFDREKNLVLMVLEGGVKLDMDNIRQRLKYRYRVDIESETLQDVVDSLHGENKVAISDGRISLVSLELGSTLWAV